MSRIDRFSTDGFICALLAPARAVFKVVQLPDDVARRMPGDAGDRAQPFEIGAMTGSAPYCLVAARREDPAFFNTSGRNIGNEAGSRVTADELCEIFRHLNNTLTDCLLLVGIQSRQKPAAHDGFWHHFGFNDPYHRSRLQG